MRREIRVSQGADVSVTTDCRVPNGYMLAPEYVDRYLGTMPHRCMPESPCDARAEDDE